MLDRHILTFNENIIGLRDFISLIGPFIEEHHEKAVKEHQLIVDAFEIAKKIEVEEDEIQKTELQNQLKSGFDGQVIKAIPLDKDKIKIEGEDNEDLPDFAIAVPVSLNPRIDQAMKAPRKTNYQKELLYKNAFIGLLSSVEWFYSQVLHFYYDKHPEAAGIKKKTMTLEDLKTFGTVQDAEKFLIDSKIEEVFRAGFDAWMDILKDEVKLKLPYVRPFFNELLEVYQRRNLLVHNGGIVNSIYISKVSSEISKDLKIGDKLTITSEYLENAICKLHIVFTLIAAELWKKLEPIEESRADILNSIAYRNMNQGRWEVSEWLSCFIKDDENLKSRVKTVGQLNFWLSRKKRGNRALVIGEVLKADFTDKSLRYQLAVSALTDNKEEFFELLPETLRTKSLEIEELLEFPIFDEMRNTSEFEEFKLTSEEFKAYKQIETNSKDDNEEETLDDVIDELIEEATTDRKEQE
jgi:hypothetical protein